MVECLFTMNKTLGPTFSTKNKEKRKKSNNTGSFIITFLKK